MTRPRQCGYSIYCTDPVVTAEGQIWLCAKHLELERERLDASLARADAALKRMEKREAS